MMIRIFVMTLLSATLVAVSAIAQDTGTEVSIIPKPVELKVNTGSFRINGNTTLVVTDQADRAAADFFNEYLRKYYGLTLEIATASGQNAIIIHSKSTSAGAGDESCIINARNPPAHKAVTAFSLKCAFESFFITLRVYVN